MFSIILPAVESRGALVVWSCVECESGAGMWWPVLCPLETPFPYPVCPPHYCLSTVFPSWEAAGWRKVCLPCQAEGGESWQQARNCSIQGDGLGAWGHHFTGRSFFCSVWEEGLGKGKEVFFADGEEKQGSKRREESLNAFQREVNSYMLLFWDITAHLVLTYLDCWCICLVKMDFKNLVESFILL